VLQIELRISFSSESPIIALWGESCYQPGRDPGIKAPTRQKCEVCYCYLALAIQVGAPAPEHTDQPGHPCRAGDQSGSEAFEEEFRIRIQKGARSQEKISENWESRPVKKTFAPLCLRGVVLGALVSLWLSGETSVNFVVKFQVSPAIGVNLPPDHSKIETNYSSV
jgi:hypothetical protein